MFECVGPYSISQKDGVILHPFLRGKRVFSLEGTLVAPTPDRVTVMSDDLSAACDSTLDQVYPSARYFYDPPGQQTRFVQCKLYERLQLVPDGVGTRKFTITLVADDPVAYTYAQTEIDISGGGTIWNYGNAVTWPVVKVYGGTFTLANVTTGLAVILNGAPLSGYAEVVMRRETIYANGDGANLLKFLRSRSRS